MARIPEDVSWDDLYPRLVLATRHLLNGRTVPGKDIDDLIHDAVMKYIAGNRIWQPQNATFFQFICGVIRSDISHGIHSLEIDTTTALTEAVVIKLSDPQSTPEETKIYLSEQAGLLEFLNEVNPLARQMAELLLQHGPLPATKLAELMGISSSRADRTKAHLRVLVVQYVEAQKGIGEAAND